MLTNESIAIIILTIFANGFSAFTHLTFENSMKIEVTHKTTVIPNNIK
jgi:hypothetical protein